MLKKIEGKESFLHICDNASMQWVRKLEMKIYLHDVHAFGFIGNLGTFEVDVQNIKYCPYCGVEVAKDECR